MRRIRIFAPFLFAGLLAACTQAPQTGSLEVTVTGLAAGVDADITVTGPTAYSESLTSTGLLTDLKLGTYTVADSIRRGG